MNCQPRINLNLSLERTYGVHRFGWYGVLQSLQSLHYDQGILLDGFIERKFCWGNAPGEARNHPRPYQEPWIGFIHVPPRVPKWFQYEQAPQSIFATQLWQESLKNCLGLFCLSEYHRQWLKRKLDLPIVNLLHPTEIPDKKFDFHKFLFNPDPKVIQIGWWLRRLNSIYYLPTSKSKKAILLKNEPYIKFLITKEREEFNLDITNNHNLVKTINYLPDQQYDELLTKNIVYLDMYDTSANNVIIECIVRNTPILVNPLPAVVEYLGENYPLYFNDRNEAAEKADDLGLIKKAHEYLRSYSFKEKLSLEYFVKSLSKSSIYKSLPNQIN
ncbi:hypothetical protein [Arthrospira platensis]|uniref:hypothetical protein n=1 Tax=Limnospira TaxID=2596745 RepID=UPI0001C38B72|nr:hypothetical protein [Arthrospira platensis]AMW26617.1 hypothetical protein AP285_00010 [Arthrospira platensis YZ]MBD2671325.1 glycosyltransferase family 1 protein [Arthrospira platensis FACHB-439]MBD2712252.1 glycosyltransferase family 1 protein [Arthrospira platensis FACHB-835]MDT9297220.1 hypothetical protein [Arthrospira platensis PCC 7345]MDT9312583.1 hypothetical protein [Limnospira sp. Paracas R14]QQW29379.1 hypothetical protein AP9108_00010 [Arthrospira sp. PCC 9108]